MRNETRNIIFNKKNMKTSGKTGKTGGKTQRNREKKKQEKNENYKKYRNETSRDFGETRYPQNKILTRFLEMLKTETRSKTRSS